MSKTHHLRLPLNREAIVALEVGDMVMLSGDITITIGLPTHKRMVEELKAGRELPVDLRGGAFFHLSAYLRESDSGTEALYMNPTTSTRYNPYMPDLIRSLNLRLIGGKGGVDAASVAAMKESGCAFLSFLGGGAPLLSESIRCVVSTHWSEYISQFRLTTLRVENLGPATVAIDARGNSVYDQLKSQAQGRMPNIFSELARQRQAVINSSIVKTEKK